MQGRKTITSLVLNLTLTGSSLVFAPALYLRYRAGGDPAGIIDGMLRLSWWWPIFFFFAIYLHAGGQLDYARGLVPVYLPLLLTLSAVGVLALGWSNDGAIVVDHPARELTSIERRRLSKGEQVFEEVDFSSVAGVAKWAHAHLPRHPFGAPPRGPAPRK